MLLSSLRRRSVTGTGLVPLAFLPLVPFAPFALAACGHGSSAKPAAAPTVSASVKERPAGNPADREAAVPIDDDDPIHGNRDALVTIVEFSDFECPFCRKEEPVIQQLLAKYKPDQLRLVWKNQPLAMHVSAKPAAEASMAVLDLGGDDAFWKFHDALLRDGIPQSFEDVAQKSAGIDPAAFKARMASGLPAEKVAHDMAIGEKLGVDGTPTFFVNGVAVPGAIPIDDFVKIVDLAAKQAQLFLDKGTPRDHLYASAVEVNYTPDAGNGDDDAVAEDTTSVWNVPVGNSPSRGSKDAPVTIVEFGDFECSYCRAAEPTVAALATKYGDKLRIVWKHDPLESLHPHAAQAAELSEEARAEKGDAGFWKAHDQLYAAQDLSPTGLSAIAKDLGLDAAKVDKALEKHAHHKAIEDDVDLATALGDRATPMFYVNGRRFAGALPEDDFAKVIDEELAHAADVTKGGVAPGKVYETIIAGGKQAPEPPTVTAPTPVHESTVVRGAANGPGVVTIVEYADFECPFCSRVQPALDQLLAEDPKLRVVWQNRPLDMHPHAGDAAEAAEEAAAQKGATGFWKMHTLLFTNQRKLERADLDGYAKEAGLDGAKFTAALDGKTHAGDIAAETKAAEEAQFEGTPSFIVFVEPAAPKKGAKTPATPSEAATGYAINGAVEASAFRRAIRLAREHAAPAAKPAGATKAAAPAKK